MPKYKEERAMSIITSLVKRRQFLLAAMGSTCALTCKKLAALGGTDGLGASSPVHSTLATQEASVAAVMAAGNRCPHLLSPLKVRDVVLKNRIMHTVSSTWFMQGPENFPAEMYRNHLSNMAKNAGIVTMQTHFGDYPKTYTKGQHGPSANFCDTAWQDIPPVHNYIDQLMEDIHCEGALILYAGATGLVPNDPGKSSPNAIPGLQQSLSTTELTAQAKDAEAQGFDAFRIDTSNLEAIRAVRNETNLLLVAKPVQMREKEGKEAPGVSNVNQPSAAEIEDVVETARKFEGLIDILWLRVDEHPSAWTQDKGRPYSLPFAEAIKKAGIKIITCPSAGFHYPIENEEFIASGKADMIGMTTPLFADPELVRKVSAGMADGVIPCIACQNCHGISMTKGPWYSTCTVNPKWGLPPYKLAGITAPRKIKKVAVIGGGPAGMKAASVAAERGHKVTLYEKSDALGGLLKISDYSQWKWTYKDLKDYFVYQVQKQGVEVLLDTKATPEMIKAKGYDTVLVAVGAAPIFSELESEGKENVFNLIDAYINKKNLGKNVVVIGGGKYGVEGALGLAKDGYKVTVLTSAKELFEPENVGPHNTAHQQNICSNHPNFSYELQATVKSISSEKVTYADSHGEEKAVQADSIVIWSGLKPRMDEAKKFAGSADEVLLLGDCTGKNGSIQTALRSAFFVASQV
jgi:2,4-dienoyl-CoA reductase-like NADH-dependent reductase (Old Yellow Enzyme family)/thioredoxin reductase